MILDNSNSFTIQTVETETNSVNVDNNSPEIDDTITITAESAANV
jgi:hypothetical protein